MAKKATRIKTTAQVYVPQSREDVASDIKTIVVNDLQKMHQKDRLKVNHRST